METHKIITVMGKVQKILSLKALGSLISFTSKGKKGGQAKRKTVKEKNLSFSGLLIAAKGGPIMMAQK